MANGMARSISALPGGALRLHSLAFAHRLRKPAFPRHRKEERSGKRIRQKQPPVHQLRDEIWRWNAAQGPVSAERQSRRGDASKKRQSRIWVPAISSRTTPAIPALAA